MRIIVYAALLTFFSACSGGKTEEAAKENPVVDAKAQRDELLKQINENNTALTNSYSPDSVLFICRAQAALCEKFIAANPMDVETPNVMAFQAKAYKGLHDPQKSVETYNRLIQNFPNYENLPEVMLVKAITIDQELQDKQRAERAYLDLIQKFPDHPFAKDAQALLTQVHMSDEELIRSFEAKNKKN